MINNISLGISHKQEIRCTIFQGFMDSPIPGSITRSSLTSTPSSLSLTSLPASFLSCSPLTLLSLPIYCLPFTSLCSSSPCTALARYLALPLILPCFSRSVQPVCAVKAVGQLQARTGTSSGLEITASAPGAPSSMRKVGIWQGPWVLGVHWGVGQAPAQAVRTDAPF